MNKYVNKQKKGYNTLDYVLFIMGQAQTRRRVWSEPIVKCKGWAQRDALYS